MTETRFPSSGLSAEYGDIIFNDVADYVFVTINQGTTQIVLEKYFADPDGVVTIREIGDLAMTFFSMPDFVSDSGLSAEPVVLQISVLEKDATEAVTKTVTIYPCSVDFSGSIDVELLQVIPLSRAVEKYTQKGRREWISFYAPATISLYAVYKGDGADTASTVELTQLTGSGIHTIDVSPSVVAVAIGCGVDDLVYYNVYKSTQAIIRYYMDERLFPDAKTFVFRNCFGAQESFTMNGDSTSSRKWTRVFGQRDNAQVQVSRDLENKFTAGSGYVSDDDIEVLEDLCNAEQITLLDEYGFQEIVITDEKFEVSDRADEVNAVEISYRFAANNQFKTKYKPFRKPRIFTTEFNETYN